MQILTMTAEKTRLTDEPTSMTSMKMVLTPLNAA